MRALRIAIGALGEFLISAGLVLLLFVVWQLWWTDVTANAKQDEIVHDLQREWKSPTLTGPSPGQPKGLAQIPIGKSFAFIRIPRFGLDYVKPMLEGTDRSVLRDGVGHYPKTADPGAVGNFAVAGHRTTYGAPFSRLDELKSNDPIVIETRDSWLIYRVDRSTIVPPTQTNVTLPVPEKPEAKPTEKLITLTTCNPKYSARERLIVFGKLAETIKKIPGVTPDVLK
jgi:sortase A